VLTAPSSLTSTFEYGSRAFRACAVSARVLVQGEDANVATQSSKEAKFPVEETLRLRNLPSSQGLLTRRKKIDDDDHDECLKLHHAEGIAKSR
jgi:hypothetical protein